MKSSLKKLIDLEKMSLHWKNEMLAEMKPIWRDLLGRQRQFCGLVMDPRKFFPVYLQRFLRRMELEGDLPIAGNYEVEFKVTIQPIHEMGYSWGVLYFCDAVIFFSSKFPMLPPVTSKIVWF